mmetsp:Transcript_13014/g.40112  ORF Transcript_13014/g.40112 Transcript_13014/m.40112 type:complete len:236 (-) Transcript_13014:662-1369(-)
MRSDRSARPSASPYVSSATKPRSAAARSRALPPPYQPSTRFFASRLTSKSSCASGWSRRARGPASARHTVIVASASSFFLRRTCSATTASSPETLATTSPLTRMNGSDATAPRWSSSRKKSPSLSQPANGSVVTATGRPSRPESGAAATASCIPVASSGAHAITTSPAPARATKRSACSSAGRPHTSTSAAGALSGRNAPSPSCARMTAWRICSRFSTTRGAMVNACGGCKPAAR